MLKQELIRIILFKHFIYMIIFQSLIMISSILPTTDVKKGNVILRHDFVTFLNDWETFTDSFFTDLLNKNAMVLTISRFASVRIIKYILPGSFVFILLIVFSPHSAYI